MTNETWKSATLILQPSNEGHHGTLHIGDITLDIRHWHKSSSGVVQMEIKYDGEWSEYLQRLTDKVAG